MILGTCIDFVWLYRTVQGRCASRRGRGGGLLGCSPSPKLKFEKTQIL